VWGRALAIACAFCVLCWFVIEQLWRLLMPTFDPQRRRVLATARQASLVVPAVAVGFGIIKRDELRLNEIDIVLPGLPKDLNGLRMVQVSDIHLSPFVSERLLERAIDMANETKAHLGLVTGDLISSMYDPLDRCMRQLARLRVDGPIVGCLGNHEIYAGSEETTTLLGERIGINFLRHEARLLRFGSSQLNVVGVDYQQKAHPYLTGTEQLKVAGVPNILLSHNPDVFPVAAEQGFDLTIAGHTHGGQINVEILKRDLNVARFFTPYIYGLYRQGSSSIFVTRGIGTVGMPVRLGAPPEVALIRLCAT
jgi:hypothetical protein